MLTLLLEASLKGSLILAAAALLTRLMRGRSAASRHLVWGVALLSAATLPVTSRLLPAWRVALTVPVVPAAAVVAPPAASRIAVTPGGETSGRTPSTGGVSPDGPRQSSAPAAWPQFPPLALLTLCWGVVAGALVLRLLAAVAGLGRLTRRADPVRGPAWRAVLEEAARSAGVRRGFRTLVCTRATVPMTWGVACPVILLPVDAEGWSRQRRRAVLIHELAHAARWDYATHLGVQLCCALYWFNPLIWLAARALRSERERACDDRVLAAGTGASLYAGELLEIAHTALGSDPPRVALAMARRTELEGRLLAILNPGLQRGTPRLRAAIGLGALALGLTLPLAAFRPGPALEPQPASTTNRRADPGEPPRAQRTVRPRSPEPAAKSDAVPIGELFADQDARTLPLEAPPTLPAGALGCDPGAGSSHSHSSSNWRDSGSKSWRVSWSRDGCSVDLVAQGDVTFNEDFSDVSTISPGGYLEITVRDGESARRLEFRPQGGTLRRTYSVNGEPAPYDAAARAWLAGFLIELDRRTAFAVDTRFPALLRQGVSAVLDEIDRMASDYARGVYYRRLLSGATLNPGEVRRVAQTAGTRIDSDYELRRVLGPLAERYALGDPAVRAAFIAAAGTLESDYERAELLLVVITRGPVSPEAGQTIVKLAGAMESDYEKARVLLALGGSRLLDPKTAAPGYLDVVTGMQSDYERGRVLKLIVGSGQLSQESLLRVFEVVGRMESDYEAANVLVAVASANQLGPAAREAYLKAADRLKSDYESQRARRALGTG